MAVEWADEQWAWRHMGQVARRMNRANRALGIPPGVLSAVRLPMNGAQLADLLNEQRRLRRHDLTEPGTMAPGGAPSADPTGGRP
ncbi:MAG: hypothetical protein Q4C85_04545 [Actinomyces sp.]|uniref:hypothetical protein n=1 Tax=Actinomyces sp. TaxID=29317 RepID=UPI0026DD15E5|nr:hypothetical protein [Actinomyces sp.]MDO4243018.1 hypothetical protein [Actinomyces sp.]